MSLRRGEREESVDMAVKHKKRREKAVQVT